MLSLTRFFVLFAALVAVFGSNDCQYFTKSSTTSFKSFNMTLDGHYPCAGETDSGAAQVQVTINSSKTGSVFTCKQTKAGGWIMDGDTIRTQAGKTVTQMIGFGSTSAYFPLTVCSRDGPTLINELDFVFL